MTTNTGDAVDNKKKIAFKRAEILRPRGGWSRTRWAFFVAAFLLLAGATYQMLHGLGRVPLSSLRVATVGQGTVSVTVQGHGSLIPAALLNISLPNGGQLKRLEVRRGQNVTKGQVLAELRNPRLLQERQDAVMALVSKRSFLATENGVFASTQLDLRSRILDLKDRVGLSESEQQATLELAEAQIISRFDAEKVRLKLLSERRQLADLITQSEHLKAVEKIRDGANSDILAALEADVERLNAEVELLTVRAPSNGVVYSLSEEINEGSHLVAGANLAQLSVGTKPKALLLVPAGSAALLRVGQAARINLNNGEIQAKVESVDLRAVRDEVQVTLELDGNVPADALSGSPISGEVVVRELRNAMHVPKIAEIAASGPTQVYRLNKGRNILERTSVVTVPAGDRYTVFASGLSPGDELITSDTRFLKGERYVPVLDD